MKLRLQEAASEGSTEGAIDRMFQSIVNTVGKRSLGCVLSGPGEDGAEGVHEIRKAGGISIVQDINNCMDPSMPLAVLKKGSVSKILPDYLVADFIVNPEAGVEN